MYAGLHCVAMLTCRHLVVTKRLSGWACIGSPKLEQETIEGTHARETPAHQRRPTTLHEVQGSSPPMTAVYMQLAKLPHHVPPLRQAQRSRHGTHRGVSKIAIEQSWRESWKVECSIAKRRNGKCNTRTRKPLHAVRTKLVYTCRLLCYNR